MNRASKSNYIVVSGKIVSEFTYSHEAFGEKFYVTQLLARRVSGLTDNLPIMVSDKFINIEKEWIGSYVRIIGQLRSYSRHENGINRCLLNIFATELSVCKYEARDKNYVELDGYICKEPIYRETPLGREIADVLLAVNRPYGKSDYIPCIAWWNNARCVGKLEARTRLKITGRIQSREYQKQISEEEYETRTAYEVSISKLEVIESEECKDQVADAE